MKELDIKKLKEYLHSRDDVTATYLFGSSVSKKPARDIDIALLLDRYVDSKNYGLIKLDIVTALIELLSFDNIDVAILNTAPPLLSHEVLKKGILLFAKDERERLDFTVKAVMRYLDITHLRRFQDTILHEKIRRGDFGHFKEVINTRLKRLGKALQILEQSRNVTYGELIRNDVLLSAVGRNFQVGITWSSI